MPSIRIDPAGAARLAEIGLDRAGMFARMAETSIPETMGCWAMPTGNFDSQLISVGMAQWNFGTGSLQPVLAAWRAQFRHKRDFKRARDTLAPTYGKLLFSKDCLAVPVADKCRAAILAARGREGRLNPVLAAELTAIFESDAMLQVQTDTYVALLDKVRLDLLRVFPAGADDVAQGALGDRHAGAAGVPARRRGYRAAARQAGGDARGRTLAAAARDHRLVRRAGADDRPGRHLARLRRGTSRRGIA